MLYMMCSIGYATKIDQNVAFQLGTFGSGTQLKFIRFFGMYETTPCPSLG